MSGSIEFLGDKNDVVVNRELVGESEMQLYVRVLFFFRIVFQFCILKNYTGCGLNRC